MKEVGKAVGDRSCSSFQRDYVEFKRELCDKYENAGYGHGDAGWSRYNGDVAQGVWLQQLQWF